MLTSPRGYQSQYAESHGGGRFLTVRLPDPLLLDFQVFAFFT